MKNYYLILGVNPECSPEQLRSAYRRQAKALHPDQTGADGSAFRELQEAYEILSDPARRRSYDAEKKSSSIATPPTRRQSRVSSSSVGHIDLRTEMQAKPDTAVPHSPNRLLLHLSAAAAAGGGLVDIHPRFTTPCPACDGAGCLACGFQGRLTKILTLRIAIPVGIRNNQVIPVRAYLPGAGAIEFNIQVLIRG
jgi:DnaJ-class molecular chaperone